MGNDAQPIHIHFYRENTNDGDYPAQLIRVSTICFKIDEQYKEKR